MNEWQPIETAPTNGAEILACWDAPTPEFKAIGVVFWNGHDAWITSLGYWPKTPTHWLPIPQPPTT